MSTARQYRVNINTTLTRLSLGDGDEVDPLLLGSLCIDPFGRLRSVDAGSIREENEQNASKVLGERSSRTAYFRPSSHVFCRCPKKQLLATHILNARGRGTPTDRQTEPIVLYACEKLSHRWCQSCSFVVLPCTNVLMAATIKEKSL